MANRSSEQVCQKLKEKVIEHSSHTPEEKEKENQKRLWKELIDETTRGFKEVLRREGKMDDK